MDRTSQKQSVSVPLCSCVCRLAFSPISAPTAITEQNLGCSVCHMATPRANRLHRTKLCAHFIRLLAPFTEIIRFCPRNRHISRVEKSKRWIGIIISNNMAALQCKLSCFWVCVCATSVDDVRPGFVGSGYLFLSVPSSISSPSIRLLADAIPSFLLQVPQRHGHFPMKIYRNVSRQLFLQSLYFLLQGIKWLVCSCC